MTTSDFLSPEREKRIIEMALGGDASQFCQLVRQYHKKIYFFIRRYLSEKVVAEDLTQETFLDAYQSLSRFRGEVRFLSWLMGIALNKVRNYLSRAPERRFDMLCLDHLFGQTDGDDPLANVQQHEFVERLAGAVHSLSEELKTPFMLVCFEELSYTEAAQLLNVPEGTVKSRVFRARRQIMKILDKL
ncbi:MAG TPA: RNA polymerase sigma factor [Syntrophales bacterium]|nr:RNA polymerase sigma factor [Syntrophales bacterium]HQI36478.1 RNA polymerase sigma factor [Syntrophales bacterium]HRU89136.1 RNA polymerase sigma factor [Syntrophales bacterium]